MPNVIIVLRLGTYTAKVPAYNSVCTQLSCISYPKYCTIAFASLFKRVMLDPPLLTNYEAVSSVPNLLYPVLIFTMTYMETSI